MEGLLKIAIDSYLELDPTAFNYEQSVLDFFRLLHLSTLHVARPCVLSLSSTVGGMATGAAIEGMC